MSRLVLACSLVAAVATSAFAHVQRLPDRMKFAQPPQDSGDVGVADEELAPDPGALTEMRVVLDRTSVRAALVQARAANLARFRAYQRAGSFPSNTFQNRKLNVWLDQDGHFCAAATIIRSSGLVDLVDRVAEQNNFIRLDTVQQGPLMDWILTSGLTQDEIASIQEPFMPVAPSPAIDPDSHVVIDGRLRRAEDARLIKRYQQVDAMIVRNHNNSLDLAVDRLMRHQDLAWKLVYSKS